VRCNVSGVFVVGSTIVVSGSRAPTDSNPSRWAHRAPAILLALAGFGIAAYLALYQWEAFPHVWEPLFGAGSRRILHSSIASALPLPDASLGAAGYLAEAVLGVLGGTMRWRSRPWLVLLYALAIIAFLIGSIVLVLAQIFYFNTGCLLCLCSAVISIVIALITPAEPRAALRFVREQRRRGLSWPAALRGYDAASPAANRAASRSPGHGA
jgi:uncharacterized membrane protein